MNELQKIAIIFAGGVGSRMNNQIPKQLLKIKNKEIIAHVIEIFENSEYIDKIYISFIPSMISDLEKIINQYGYNKVAKIVPGGDNGQASIYNALKAASEENSPDSIVFIHDGVRPFVSDTTIIKNFKQTIEKGNSITVTSATETITVVNDNDQIESIYDREKCCLAQAPQVFYLKDILEAHNNEINSGEKYDKVIDSATLYTKHFPEKKLNITLGDSENIKITRENDLIIANAYLDKSSKFKKEEYNGSN